MNVIESFFGRDLKVSVKFDKYSKHINTIQKCYKENYDARFTEYRRNNSKKLEEHFEKKKL